MKSARYEGWQMLQHLRRDRCQRTQGIVRRQESRRRSIVRARLWLLIKGSLGKAEDITAPLLSPTRIPTSESPPFALHVSSGSSQQPEKLREVIAKALADGPVSDLRCVEKLQLPYGMMASSKPTTFGRSPWRNLKLSLGGELRPPPSEPTTNGSHEWIHLTHQVKLQRFRTH